MLQSGQACKTLTKSTLLQIRNPDIEGKAYQEGPQLGFWNVREYVLWRDYHTCQRCFGTSKSPILNVHHIESRKTGGDNPDNLNTLCETCHQLIHRTHLEHTIKRKSQSSRDATQMGIIRRAIYEQAQVLFPVIHQTYGYITKHIRITHELEIPTSLITNDPDAVLDFFERCKGEMIYKTLSGGMIVAESGEVVSVYSSRVTRDNLRDEGSRVRYTACLFQELVPRKVELRITVVGDHVFPASISYRHPERAAVDWRTAYQDLQYGIYELPQEIHHKCLEVVRKLGLSFAAIDMIVIMYNQKSTPLTSEILSTFEIMRSHMLFSQ